MLDEFDHLIDVVTCNNQSTQDVHTFLGLTQIILGASDDHIMTMLHEVAYEIAKCQQLWASLDQCNAVHTETGLQRCHLEEFVENYP